MWVTSAASASAVSAGPAVVLRGLRRCLRTSGRGMIEPEDSLPVVTRTWGGVEGAHWAAGNRRRGVSEWECGSERTPAGGLNEQVITGCFKPL